MWILVIFWKCMNVYCIKDYETAMKIYLNTDYLDQTDFEQKLQKEMYKMLHTFFTKDIISPGSITLCSGKNNKYNILKKIVTIVMAKA